MDQSRAQEATPVLIGHFSTWWRGDPLPRLRAVPDLAVAPCADDRLVASLMGIDVGAVRERIQRGHRPWLARIGEVPVGWGWVAASEAEIPELGITFALQPGDRYLWDFMTLPPWRGHDVYPALLHAILVAEEATRFWIGHDRDNPASARGMAKAGFHEVGTAHRRPDGQLMFVPSASAERAAAAVVYLSLPMTDL
jgi:hypothetical protein